MEIKNEDQRKQIEESLRRGKEKSLERKIQREFRRAAATGRASSFLEKTAQKNELVAEALNAFKIQSLVPSVSLSSVSTPRSADKSSPNNSGANFALPKIPDNAKTYVLGVVNGEVKWIETESC